MDKANWTFNKVYHKEGWYVGFQINRWTNIEYGDYGSRYGSDEMLTIVLFLFKWELQAECWW